MHIVDALGSDWENQIGKGDVDFVELARTLDENNIDAMFLPEVWQGHKILGRAFEGAGISRASSVLSDIDSS